ncbi:hypothetical protein QAD02_021954 [Eretmocerus hayati]|uniref:Uncharacterized protein n=1 Tax=Eretmocerus hayati TaxID=131215 RepID=A0ACC2PWH4_9HYME|nr:hypothetical protein QAD02_021954 [Eretmocerus hayati]
MGTKNRSAGSEMPTAQLYENLSKHGLQTKTNLYSLIPRTVMEQYNKGYLPKLMASLSGKNNLIVYGIPEKDEKDQLRNYLTNMLREAPFEPASIQYKRIGKKSADNANIRPVKQKSEKRKSAGEPNLVLKYVKVIPVIYDPGSQAINKQANPPQSPQQLISDATTQSTSNSNDIIKAAALFNNKKN